MSGPVWRYLGVADLYTRGESLIGEPFFPERWKVKRSGKILSGCDRFGAILGNRLFFAEVIDTNLKNVELQLEYRIMKLSTI